MARAALRAVVAMATVALLLSSYSGPERSSAARPQPAETAGVLAAALQAPAASWPPADCVPRPTPQVQIGVLATFSASFALEHEVSAPITGQICGIGTLVNPPPGACPAPSPTRRSVGLEFSVPADGQIFRIDSVDITIVPGVTPHIPDVHVITHPIAALICASYGPGGPINISLTVPITASASFFGTNCVLAPTVPLSGYIYGPLGNFTASLRAAFSVPAPLPNPACSPALTTAVDGLLGLPSPPDSARLNLTVHGQAYCLVRENLPLCMLEG